MKRTTKEQWIIDELIRMKERHGAALEIIICDNKCTNAHLDGAKVVLVLDTGSEPDTWEKAIDQSKPLLEKAQELRKYGEEHPTFHKAVFNILLNKGMLGK